METESKIPPITDFPTTITCPPPTPSCGGMKAMPKFSRTYRIAGPASHFATWYSEAAAANGKGGGGGIDE